MALANILGTNTLEVALFLTADIFYLEGNILNHQGLGGIFLAALGAILTCIYLWGILERKDKTFLGMGIDSLLIIFIYIAGMITYSFKF